VGRLADDIRRIVEVDKINKRLDDVEEKAELLARRGEAYYSANGTLITSSGAGGSTANPLNSSALKGTNMKSGGTGLSAAQAATSGTKRLDSATDQAQNGLYGEGFGAEDAIVTIDDLLDAVNSNDPSGDLSGIFDDPSNQILGLSAMHDCASGTDFSLRFDGNFNPVEGWEDPSTPPADSTWELGKYYQINRLYSSQDNPVQAPTWDLVVTKWNAQAPAGEIVVTPPGSMTTAYWAFTLNDAQRLAQSVTPPDLTRALAGDLCAMRTDGSAAGSGVPIASHPTCTSGGTLPAIACGATTVPKETAWPATGEFQVTQNDEGYFVTSPYDTEVPSRYKTPQTTLEFCYGAGLTGKIEKTRDGGHMIYRTSGGAIAGSAVVFNKAGQAVAFTDNITPYKVK
jgi:hypothetical protein